MPKVKVRWAFCAADPSKNGKTDHVEAELAGALERDGRLTVLAEQPPVEAAPVAEQPAARRGQAPSA